MKETVRQAVTSREGGICWKLPMQNLSEYHSGVSVLNHVVGTDVFRVKEKSETKGGTV